jgi:hypothetical protein
MNSDKARGYPIADSLTQGYHYAAIIFYELSEGSPKNIPPQKVQFF